MITVFYKEIEIFQAEQRANIKNNSCSQQGFFMISFLHQPQNTIIDQNTNPNSNQTPYVIVGKKCTRHDNHKPVCHLISLIAVQYKISTKTQRQKQEYKTETIKAHHNLLH